MKLIGQPKPFKPTRLVIEDFHRVALGLESGTRVYMSAVPYVKRDPTESPAGARFREILFTTFAPRLWERIWRVNIAFDDRAGVVADALNILQITDSDVQSWGARRKDVEKYANVQLLETLTTENGASHEALAFVDMKRFGIRSSRGMDFAKLQEVAEKLSSKIAGRLKDKGLDVNWCSAQPMHRLVRAATARANGGVDGHFVGKVEGGVLHCDEKELLRLVGPAPAGEPSVPTRCVMYSDTEEKYIALSFPPNRSVLMQTRVDHFEQPGALRSFAESIRDHDSSIMASYSRIESGGRRAQWVVTIDLARTGAVRSLIEGLEDNKAHYLGLQRLRLNYELATVGEGDESDASRGVGDSVTAGSAEDSSTQEAAAVPRPRRPEKCPYQFTGGRVEASMFKGRDYLLEPIVGKTVFRSGTLDQNYLISGYYKTGKSCLLTHVQAVMENHNSRVQEGSDQKRILPVLVNLNEVTSPEWFFTSLLDKAQEALDSNTEGQDANTSKGWLSVFSRRPASLGDQLRPDHDDSSARHVQWIEETFDEQSKKVSAVFRELVARVKSEGYSSIVFLLDEAQHVLHDTEPGNHLAELWRLLVDEVGGIRWVVASSRDWRYVAEQRSGLMSKLVALELGPLLQRAARDLIREPFASLPLGEGRSGILVHREAVDLIEEVSGRQPCYIQAIGRFVFDELGLAPENVDVITKGMVEVALPRAITALGHHFYQMYHDLSQVLERQAFDAALSEEGLELPLREMLSRESSGVTERDAITFAVIPGLVIKKGKRGDVNVAVCRMFSRWARSTGVVKVGR